MCKLYQFNIEQEMVVFTHGNFFDRWKWGKINWKTEFDAKNVYFGEVFSFHPKAIKSFVLCTFFKSESNMMLVQMGRLGAVRDNTNVDTILIQKSSVNYFYLPLRIEQQNVNEFDHLTFQVSLPAPINNDFLLLLKAKNMKIRKSISIVDKIKRK